MVSYTFFGFYCIRCAKYKHTTSRTDKVLNVCKDCKYEIVKEWIEQQKLVTTTQKQEPKTGE